jgi:hypothetical protein
MPRTCNAWCGSDSHGQPPHSCQSGTRTRELVAGASAEGATERGIPLTSKYRGRAGNSLVAMDWLGIHCFASTRGPVRGLEIPMHGSGCISARRANPTLAEPCQAFICAWQLAPPMHSVWPRRSAQAGKSSYIGVCHHGSPCRELDQCFLFTPLNAPIRRMPPNHARNATDFIPCFRFPGLVRCKVDRNLPGRSTIWQLTIIPADAAQSIGMKRERRTNQPAGIVEEGNR